MPRCRFPDTAPRPDGTATQTLLCGLGSSDASRSSASTTWRTATGSRSARAPAEGSSAVRPWRRAVTLGCPAPPRCSCSSKLQPRSRSHLRNVIVSIPYPHHPAGSANPTLAISIGSAWDRRSRARPLQGRSLWSVIATFRSGRERDISPRRSNGSESGKRLEKDGFPCRSKSSRHGCDTASQQRHKPRLVEIRCFADGPVRSFTKWKMRPSQ